eukprot:m.60075 g.60075  ORF g.60075 m.60075 type:complete len:368 (-) comp11350_c0_seq1:750-1853(-)
MVFLSLLKRGLFGVHSSQPLITSSVRCCCVQSGIGRDSMRRKYLISSNFEQKASFHIHSPLVESEVFTERVGRRVLLKLDNVQPSGSFKIRGIGNTCKKAFESGKTKLVSSSGGNAGNAVAYAGKKLGMDVTVIVPSSTSKDVINKISRHGAHVEVHGSVWDEADEYARKLAEDPQAAYVHPFGQETTWEGHSSLVEEIKQDVKGKKPGLICVSVGGGGLLLGVFEGLDRAGWSDVPVLAVETIGADSLHQSMVKGSLVTLDDITSIAKTLGAKTVATKLFEECSKRPVFSVAVSDASCLKALKFFADTHRMLVEPSCAASFTPLLDQPILSAGLDVASLQGDIVVIVCGGMGVDLNAIEEWEKKVM